VKPQRPKSLDEKRGGWPRVLTHAEVMALDMTLDHVIDALLLHSDEVGVIPFAQRFTICQLRAIRDKMHKP
jgi:hypothetical protein